MSRAEKAARAAELYAQGMTGTRIAEIMGISSSHCYDLLSDPSGEKLRARKARYETPCAGCGRTVNSNSPPVDGQVCIRCAMDERTIWTRDAIVLAIQEWADENGGIPPAANDFYRAGATDRNPSVVTVQKQFGTWNAAIRAAGFEPHPCGPVGGYETLTEEQRFECARRYAAGESTPQIAADFGCTPGAVAKWVRRAGVPMRQSFSCRDAA